MSLINTAFGILLSLVLGLSSAVSVTHNHYFHDRLTVECEHDHQDLNPLSIKHHHQSSDDGHDESGCVFTVVQYTESLIAHVIPYFSLKTPNVKKITVYLGKRITQPNNGFFARAPPLQVFKT